jgi:hypothetical protein
MMGYLVNNELEVIWEEAVMVYFQVLPRWTRKTTKITSVRKVSVLAEI